MDHTNDTKKQVAWNTRPDTREDVEMLWGELALRPGEKVRKIYIASALWPTVGTGLVLGAIAYLWTNPWTILFAVLGTIAYGWGERQNRWALTNERLIQRNGVAVRKSGSIDLNRITDVRNEEAVANSLWRRGKVYVNTAGRAGDEIVIFGQGDTNAILRDLSR